MPNIKNQTNFYQEVKTLLQNAKSKIYSNINSTMTQTYWLIGQKIVIEEQNGKSRAEYGKSLLKNLSSELTKEFGKDYSEDNLKKYKTIL